MAKQVVVRAQAVSGRWEVLGADRNAGVWPENVQMEWDEWGPSHASFDIHRDGSRPWPELGAFAPVELMVDGMTVWDGRVKETPSRVRQRQMNVQCEGWQYHLDDDVFDTFYVHNDLSKWKDVRGSLTKLLGNVSAGALGLGQVNIGDGAITLILPTFPTTGYTAGTGAAAYLDLGPGNLASAISIDYDTLTPSTYAFYIRGLPQFADGSIDWGSGGWGAAVNDVVSGETMSSMGSSGTRSGAFTTPSRYILMLLYAASSSTTTIDIGIRIKRAQVFAKDTWRSSSKSILKASDVVIDSLSKGTTLLSSDRSRVGALTVVQDGFDQATASSISGQFTATGQRWVTYGDTSPDMSVGSGVLQRASSPPSDIGRNFTIAEGPTFDAVTVQCDLKYSGTPGAGNVIAQGVVARYNSPTDYVAAIMVPDSTSTNWALILEIETTANGISAAKGTFGVDMGAKVANTWYTIRMALDGDGSARVWFYVAGGAPGNPLIVTSDPGFSGLPTGRVGILDVSSAGSTVTRNYDNFSATEGMFNIPTFAPEGPQTARQNWEAVDSYHDWIKKIDVGRVPVYKARPATPVLEVGNWSALDDEDASANSGEDVYNKAIVTGQAPSSDPVRVTGTAAASPAGESILNAQVTIQLDVGGSAASSFSSSLIDLSNHVPYLVRLVSVTRSGGTGGLPIDIYAGWNDFTAINIWNTGDLVHLGPISTLPLVGGSDLPNAVWTPTILPVGADFSVGVSAPGGGTAGSTATVIVDLVWGGTAADRRGFAKAKILPISAALPADGVAGERIGNVWAAGHRTAPFRGSAPLTGDGSIRIIDTGETLPLQQLGSYTGQLVRFGDRADPDRGGWGRDGRIVAVSYNPQSEEAVLTLDNTRASFEAMLARLDLLSSS